MDAAEGLSGTAAAERLDGLSADDKEALLAGREIVFRDVPAWQRRGVALYEETYEKRGVDPRTGEGAVAERRRLRVDLDLPAGPVFGAFVHSLLVEATSADRKNSVSPGMGVRGGSSTAGEA